MHFAGMSESCFASQQYLIPLQIGLPPNKKPGFPGNHLIQSEIEKGTTDRVIEKSITILEDAFLGNRSKEEAIAQIVSRFEWIEIKPFSNRLGDGCPTATRGRKLNTIMVPKIGILNFNQYIQ